MSRGKGRTPPKFLERIFPFFGVFWMSALAGCGAWAIRCQEFAAPFGALLVLVYLLPPLLARVVMAIWPLKEGFVQFGKLAPTGNTWWLLHQLQTPYLSFTFFERAMRLVPGAYSLWLRLWGSQIGRAVHWTPRVSVVDRTSLVIGDKVILGDYSYLSAHVVLRRRGKISLLHEKVHIGNSSTLGLFCVASAGVRIAEGSVVEAGKQLYPRERYPNETRDSDAQSD